MQTTLVDLHVHPALPFVGEMWRKVVQRFQIQTLDGSKALMPAAPRVYGAVFYQTFLTRPDLARKKLFHGLATFQERLAAIGGPRLVLQASDLNPVGQAQSGSSLNITGEFFFLAVESMRYLKDPGDVRRLWDMGVRSLQPIHFLNTRWGGSSREGVLPESKEGLTGLGREMLAEMAKLGMILDIAHMSANNAQQSLATYSGPVMCSHTGLITLKASARNVTADLAKEIFRRRGVVGITCWRHLLGKDPGIKSKPKSLINSGNPETNSADNSTKGVATSSGRAAWTRAYCATVAAFAELSPGALVAIGSDRGAPINAPNWFYSPSHLSEMSQYFSDLGWSPEHVQGFFHGNALDFLARALPGS